MTAQSPLRWSDADRSFTIPLAKSADKKTVKLPEPTIDQMSDIQDLVAATDEECPDLVMVDNDAAPDEIEKAVKSAKDWREFVYGEKRGYGETMVKIIGILTDEDYTTGDLPTWCSNPQTIRRMLRKWTDPFAGEPDPDLEAVVAAAGAQRG